MSLLPSTTSPISMSLSFGRFEWRAAQRQLLASGQRVVLTRRAADLLAVLIHHRERTLPKDELLSLVWPHAVVEVGNLYVHVNALRKVLGPEHITTVPGRGYRFTSPLGTAVSAGPSAASDESERRAPGEQTLGNLSPSADPSHVVALALDD